MPTNSPVERMFDSDDLVQCVVRLLRGTKLTKRQADSIIKEINQCLEM